MNKLCKVLVGSHLYGLNTPNSDLDIKGVFLSSLEDCILQNVPKDISTTTGNSNSKNSANDVDEQYFSLHHFIKLLAKGEIICFDLLHARGKNLLETSDIWEFLYENRCKLYSKRLNGFIGFVISQTRKYSQRGNRYNSVNDVCDFLSTQDPNVKLLEIWDQLPMNAFANYSKDSKGNIVYSVCERMVHPTVTVQHALKVFSGYKTLYGNRAIAASQKEGYDLKAISHAFRCIEELEQIINERDITFPIKNRERILNIKLGIEEPSDSLFDELESRVEDLKKLLDSSDLPNTIDYEFWNNWIISLYLK